MKNLESKENEIIRLYAFPPNSRNAKAIVRQRYTDGRTWISNTSIGGNLNMVLSQKDLAKLTSTT